MHQPDHSQAFGRIEVPRLEGRGLPGEDRARTMRRFATGLLVVMAALFLMARALAPAHPGWRWLLAFSEAAMVGGVADWFAVTALFRHPFGIRIPHTAIIPENKDRIADSMAAFLRAYFLTPPVVARRLRSMNLAATVGAFLADPSRGAEARIRQGAASLLGDVLQSLDGKQLGQLVRSSLGGQLQRLEVAPLIGQLLHASIADRRHLPLIESVLRWAGLTLEDNEDLLRSVIHERANKLMRWTGLDEKLANALLDGFYKVLAECIVDPDHPLRHRVEEGLQQLAHDLVHDAGLQARVEEMKHEILANPAMVRWLDGVWERLRGGLLKATKNPEVFLSGNFGEGLASFGRALESDARLQFLINRFARRTIVGVVTRYGDGIVTLVSETVKRWDAHTVTDRIEGAVGRDLQFIRVNGTVVGGLVGLAIHAVDTLL